MPAAPAPTGSDVDVPPGFWARDEHHLGPVPPLEHGLWIEAMSSGFQASMARYGLPVVGFGAILVRGWVYGGFVPLEDGAEIGRRIATRLALPADAEVRAVRRWLDVELPRWIARRRTLGDRLADADDGDLAAHVDGSALGLAELIEARFADIAVAAMFAEWVLTAAEVLGWDASMAAAWVRGHSASTTALARALAALGSDPVDDAGLGAVLDEHGDLCLGSDVLAPTIREQPRLVLELARRSRADIELAGAGEPDFGDVDAAVHDRLLGALTGARLSQTWREATGDEIACWLGLLRRVGLAAGSRLADRGQLDAADDALFLTAPELVAGLRGEVEDGRGLVAERRAAHAAAAADPPPPVLGVPPAGPAGPPPGLELPPRVARAMACLGWIGQHLGAPPGAPVVDATTISGVAAAPGRVDGTARVIVDFTGLEEIEPGEILVCSTTSPAWDPILAIAGAIVCDGGGFISHPALMARELGIPAVVGTRVATGVLRSGDRIVVDGDAGTVERN